ncbi:MAG: Fe-S cluster assembly protein SufD [Flavobacteriales bacterium]|jgi:Fe-S cluster assembly protein SufD|uniref:Fe-S cluster assembly protein SufD n=1 Tax=Blattabacterium sp. (Mastotermes darwiniensis) TaxID=39768 RepID=UPI000231DF27|nr:Fe-S cluster assembly protein SufD [Blattabacterium sp. (Mastotermes darwiniensis)]AER40859.1 SufBCD Fe-S assembly scaffold, FADH2-dependent [Blattabacterium sp. (Mastotermes darwiniensis) str. MADAR]MDR1804706.1 Fe-S cluster assembly protein SufD [Flavobacteriales bacterium]
MLLKDRVIYCFSKINYNEKYSYISELRNKSIDIFKRNGFPSIKDEEWKNTDIQSIINQDYNIYLQKKNDLEYKNIKKIQELVYLKKEDSFLIIFVDGKYNAFLSHTSNNIVLSNIASQKEEKIKNFYGKLSYRYEPFNTLNTVFSNDGVYIYIPNNVFLKKPIEILHIYTGIEPKIMLNTRNLIIVGESSRVKIIEHHKSLLEEQLLLNNVVSEIYALSNSKIEYYKIQDQELSMIDNTFLKQDLHSKCSVYTFSFKGKFIRNNLNFYSRGEKTSSSLYGISLLSGKQLVDNHTLIDHLYSNSHSFQLYKNILWGSSKSIFNGKVLVKKGTKGINAFQKNNNILLSDKSCIYAKPQLEIFSDEVKCSHGCTIGSFHESDLFYLQSRGISEKESRVLLLLSFLEEVLKPINIFKLKNLVHNQIKKKLGLYL